MTDLGRDVTGLFMNIVSFEDFMRMRLVCRRWLQLSLDCQLQWYNWLKFNGPLQEWCYYDHRDVKCKDPDECNINAHHWRKSRVPRLLKTVPLSIQVFQIATRKRERRFRRAVKYAEDNINAHHTAITVWQRSLITAKVRLACGKAAAAEVQELRQRRKRKRIHISNDLLK